MPPPFAYRPATWRTAGAGHRPWRAAVVKLSSRIDVEWLEPTPIEDAREGDLTVSRAGTLDAAIVTPLTGEAFVVVSMYALWEKPYPTTRSSWIYADAAVHRLISLISQSLWGNRRATVFLRRVTSTSCTGMGITEAATGPLALRLSSTECARWGCPSWARKRPRVAARTRGLTSSRVQATTSPRTTRITRRQSRPPGSSTSCSPPRVSLNSVRSARGTSRMPGGPVIIAKSTSSWPDQPASRGRRVRCAGRPSGDRALPSLAGR